MEVRTMRNSDSGVTWITRIVVAAILVAGLLFPQSAEAQSVRIVAVGASNTNGKGVRKSSAWPAQLQAMLRAKGHKASVIARGVNGNTTSQMRARLNRAVGRGTKIVILALPLTNDRRRKVDTYKNLGSMRAILEKRGIATIVMSRPHVWAGHQMQSDRIHFNVAGHRTVAAKLLPLVIAKIGK